MNKARGVRSLTICAILFFMATAGLAQQGWSRAQTIRNGDRPATINAVAYDGDRVWVVGADGFLARSFDDGRTFTPMHSGVDAGLNDVFVRGKRVWVVGDGGTILVSKDGGVSFVKSIYQTLGPGATRGQGRSTKLDLYSVQFINDDDGFIVGDEGLILRTENGGFTWRELRSDTTEQLFHLSFRGDDGWVVGTNGTILRTKNGGENWFSQRSGTKDDLNRVYFVNDKIGIITGDNGSILRTSNGGFTWHRVETRVRVPLFGISFIDKETGWVVGYKGRIIRTYDGGNNWVEQASGTQTDLFAVSFRGNEGYAIGRDGLLLRYYERR